MNAVGMLLLAAATATSDVEFGKAHVGGLRLTRRHAVVHGAPPPGGMVAPPPAAAGCTAGHPGCAGGAGCGAAMAGPGGPGMMAGPGGPGGPGGASAGRRFPNVRSQLYFVEPLGMQIGWQTAAGGGERVYLPAQLVVPARYNFVQGYIYRLKLTNIAGEPGLSLYPTLEVAPSTPATDAYLTHNPIPVQFTREDIDQVKAGNFVTKVIYLPDPKYQELAVAGVETLVSTRLEPGVDPILEADRRGTILLIVRLGGIDLEMPVGGSGLPPGNAVVGGPVIGSPVVGGDVTAPVVAPNAMPAPFPAQTGGVVPSVPVDNAPVSPAAPAGDVAPAPGQIPTAPPAGLPAGEVAPPPAPSFPAPADAPAPGDLPDADAEAPGLTPPSL